MWLPRECVLGLLLAASRLKSERMVSGLAWDPHGTMFVDENGVTLRGWIDSEDLKLWGPDVRVQLANIEQHTEGRDETSRAMLDLSISGLTGHVWHHRRLVWAWTVPCTQVNLQLGVREHTVHQETDHVTSWTRWTRALPSGLCCRRRDEQQWRMQFGFKRGAATLTLSQTNLGERGVWRALRSDADADEEEWLFFIESVCCEAPSGLRRSSIRWWPDTSLDINDTKKSVPVRASTAQQSAVLSCEQLISERARHFFRSYYWNVTRVPRFPWSCVCLSQTTRNVLFPKLMIDDQIP